MGKVEIDHTGSGSGITLSSDGTSLLLDGTAIGGGGGDPDLYRDNASSATTPVASGTNAVSIGSNSTATGTASVAVGLGDGDATGDYAFAVAGQATNTSAISIGTSSAATGFKSVSLGADSRASGTRGVAIGANAQAISGANATAIADSYASGTDSFAAAIGINTSSFGATGNNSLAIGVQCKATSSYSVSIGRNNVSTGQMSAALGGYSSESTANWSTTVGGRANTADASYSVASGYGAEVRGIVGKVVHAPILWLSSGDTQSGQLVLLAITTNATGTVLTSTGGSASTTNQVILPNNSAYAFHGTIVARQQAADGTACAAWKVEGLIRREANAGTTVLVNSATTVLDNTPNWGMALSADTTNGGLAITCTGAASTDIRWVATIHTSEVTYA